MKLHADSPHTFKTVTAYGPDYIEVNAVRHPHSLLVTPTGEPARWPVDDFDALTAADFDAVAAQAPQLVVFGTGSRLRFPAPALIAELTNRQIGVEVMDLAAACRTYNILCAEGRNVLAALLLETR